MKKVKTKSRVQRPVQFPDRYTFRLSKDLSRRWQKLGSLERRKCAAPVRACLLRTVAALETMHTTGQ